MTADWNKLNNNEEDVKPKCEGGGYALQFGHVATEAHLYNLYSHNNDECLYNMG